jgi:hypothetical protein
LGLAESSTAGSIALGTPAQPLPSPLGVDSEIRHGCRRSPRGDRFEPRLAKCERGCRVWLPVPATTTVGAGRWLRQPPGLCPTTRLARRAGPSPTCGTFPPVRPTGWRTGAERTAAATEGRGSRLSQWLAGFESSCVITITSIPEREATEYFTKLEGDRSREPWQMARIRARRTERAESGEEARPAGLEPATPGLEGPPSANPRKMA